MTTALRSRLPISLLLASAWFALLGATHCGGEAQSAGVANAGAGTTGSSGSGAAGSPSACRGPLSTPVGRPQAVACPATAIVAPVVSPACSADSDCADAGFNRCMLGKCSPDECLTDSDCPSDNTCSCSGQLRGNVRGRGNSCLPTGCHVDADCGPGGACSPSTSGRCGSLTGYQCHSAADTCHSDADCCGNTPQCGYQPELGHWTCAAITVCNG
jgi:hypothetical protein